MDRYLQLISQFCQNGRNSGIFVQIKELVMQGQLETNTQVSFINVHLRKAVVPCLRIECMVLLAE